MKKLNHTITYFLLMALMMTISAVNTYAQNHQFDKKRMNQDISIMQDVLGKIFNENQANGFQFFNQKVEGVYVPKFGVIFRIPGSSLSLFRNVHLSKGSTGYTKKMNYYFTTDEKNNNHQDLTKEDIIEKAEHFLSGYADAIGQLKPNDHILIVYQKKKGGFTFVGIGDSLNNNHKFKAMNLVISAKKSDIAALRANKINTKAFHNRLTIQDTSDLYARDYSIMAGILETALKPGKNSKFSLRGDVNFTAIPGYGVIYFMKAGYNSNGYFYFSNNNDHTFVIPRPSGNLTKLSSPKNKKATDIKKEFDQFRQEVKRYLIDYGRTVRSLKKGENIILSVSIDQDSDLLPERVEFEVSQKVLSDYDRRKMNMSDAMNRVKVTDY
jgi:hypothetical protein